MLCIVSGTSRDDARQAKDDELTDSALGIVHICSGLAYETLKSGLVSYHCGRMGYSACRNNSLSA